MIRVRSIERGDRPWVIHRLEGAFGGVSVARKGVLIDASVLPGFVATDGGAPSAYSLTTRPTVSARWSPSSARRSGEGSAGP